MCWGVFWLEKLMQTWPCVKLYKATHWVLKTERIFLLDEVSQIRIFSHESGCISSKNAEPDHNIRLKMLKNQLAPYWQKAAPTVTKKRIRVSFKNIDPEKKHRSGSASFSVHNNNNNSSIYQSTLRGSSVFATNRTRRAREKVTV